MLKNYKKLANKIHVKFNVNLSLCKIIGQRWSFIYEAGDFTYGSNRIKIDDNYGFIIQCNTEILKNIKKHLIDSTIV